TYEQICTLLGGTYLGDDVVCPEPPAACCTGVSCTIITEDDCTALDGVFHADWPDCLPSICHAEGPPCPPAGDDIFTDTHAAFFFEVPGTYERRPIVVNGPTTVRRAEPEFQPDGSCVIDTEIIQMNLTGTFDVGAECPGTATDPLAVTVILNPSQPSLGAITSSENGGLPDYPAESFFDVFVEITIDGNGPYPHTINLSNTLTRGDLWGDPPCVDPEGPYVPPSNDHAHIPCPPGDPPTGCCELPAEAGDGCFVTYEQICTLLG
ncbi:MAG: hypothetical protein GY778_18775, partial [bacterium]|nr:hypothetical protein [bacterium]